MKLRQLGAFGVVVASLASCNHWKPGIQARALVEQATPVGVPIVLAPPAEGCALSLADDETPGIAAIDGDSNLVRALLPGRFEVWWNCPASVATESRLSSVVEAANIDGLTVREFANKRELVGGSVAMSSPGHLGLVVAFHAESQDVADATACALYSSDPGVATGLILREAPAHQPDPVRGTERSGFVEARGEGEAQLTIGCGARAVSFSVTVRRLIP